ncbi:uncharacterized protein LOC115627994 [Scaptodrosophila lebanonensis]|uniref:Uncharacterized protein LOC115627994 n=1 Tax=Drosophila lebanonensis TaxID=7225 RepID=A0A6J2TW21_DROLE|nr:uncharacterized protein LOC115627994 [Scaptodrosophila lebanonensis]
MSAPATARTAATTTIIARTNMFNSSNSGQSNNTNSNSNISIISSSSSNSNSNIKKINNILKGSFTPPPPPTHSNTRRTTAITATTIKTTTTTTTRRTATTHYLPLLSSVLLLLLLLLLLPTTTKADWLMDCGNCHCKWNSGKKTADCKNLSLSAVPENLSSELQVLDLSHNRIPYLEQNAFLTAKLQNLHKLFIRNSTLEQVNPRSFTQLEILIELDLSNNLLRILQPNVFARLIKVRALVLNGNLLESLGPGVFHNLKYLHKIELKHNRLMRIDAQAFVGVPLLSQIYLDSNQLSLLRKESFEGLKRLTALSLDGNPWNCTCELQLFRDFVLRQNLYTPPTACFYPLQLRSMLWIEDQPEAFACKPKIIYPTRGASINTSKENVTLVCRVHASANTIIAWDYNKQLYRSTTTSTTGGTGGTGSGAGMPASTLASSSSTALLGHGDNQRVHIQLLRDEAAKEEEFGRDIFISRLTILGADKSDEGIYTCLAENAGGKDAVQMSLLVQKTGPRDLLMHSNLFIVICLMALGLLSVSVLLSMITCCIYKRFKHLNPSHHEHMRHLNLSPQQLAGNENERTAINVVIAGGTEVLLDSVSTAENTSLSNYKHHKATADLTSNTGGGGGMAGSGSVVGVGVGVGGECVNSKYVDVIKCGNNSVIVGYLDNQGGAAEAIGKRSGSGIAVGGGVEERGAHNHGENQYLEQKSEDKSNARPTQAELSRASSGGGGGGGGGGGRSGTVHSFGSLSRGTYTDNSGEGRQVAVEYQPDLLPAYRTTRGSHHKLEHPLPPSEELQHNTNSNTNSSNNTSSSRSKYNINVQEYLQSKYGAGKLGGGAANLNNNNKHNTTMNSNNEEERGACNRLATMPIAERMRISKSLVMTRPQPTERLANTSISYEYRQPPPPPYSASCRTTTGSGPGSGLGSTHEPATLQTYVTTSASASASASSPAPSLSILNTTIGGGGSGTIRRQLL